MRNKRYPALLIWALILLVPALPGQKIPESWTLGQLDQLPLVTLDTTKQVATTAQAEELYRQIVALGQHRQNSQQLLTMCEQFLRQHPNHSLRYNVWQLIKHTRKKNIMLFALGSQIVMPDRPCGIFVMGRGVSSIKFELWQVDLAATMQDGLDIHFPRTSRHARLLKSWQEKIKDSGFRFSKRLELAPLKPGYYTITANAGDIRSDLVLIVSRLALVVKQDVDKIVAWGRYTDAKPLTNPLTLYLLYNHQIVKQTTSNNGGLWAARLRGHKIPLTLVAIDSNRNLAIVDCQWYRNRQALYRAFIYLDRPFYYPGQTVRGKVFLRYFDLEQRQYLLPPPGAKLHVALQNTANWKRLGLATLAVNDSGTMDFCFSLPPEAQVGKYCLRLFGWCLAQKYFALISRGNNAEPPVISPSQNKPPEASTTEVVTIHTARQRYRPGETAVIQLKKTGPGIALLTGESDVLLSYCLATDDCRWTLDVDRWFFPCTDIVATMANGEGITMTRQSLAVPPQHQMLRINISTDQVAYRPGEKVATKITVSDDRGRPAVAKLLLSVSPHHSTIDGDNIFNFFYGRRLGEVLTFDSFQVDFASDREYSVFRPHPAKKQASPKSAHGQTPLNNSVLPDFGYWQPLVVSDANGKAQVNFIMFPTAGQWDITVLAIDKQTRVGQRSLTIRSGQK